MPEKIKILYIDDEPDNLVGFKASLRLDYNILTAVNVPQALSCLDNHPDIRIIFTIFITEYYYDRGTMVVTRA